MATGTAVAVVVADIHAGPTAVGCPTRALASPTCTVHVIGAGVAAGPTVAVVVAGVHAGPTAVGCPT